MPATLMNICALFASSDSGVFASFSVCVCLRVCVSTVADRVGDSPAGGHVGRVGDVPAGGWHASSADGPFSHALHDEGRALYI